MTHYVGQAQGRIRAEFVSATDSTAVVVDVGEMKDHHRIFHDMHDDLVDGYIKAATETLQEYAGRRFLEETWDVVLDEFPADDWIELPIGKLASVTSLQYTDDDGVTQSVALGNLVEDKGDDHKRPRVYLAYNQSWPSVRGDYRGVKLRAKLGWANQAAVPDAVKLAVKLLGSFFYEHPEAAEMIQGGILERLPYGVKWLLRRWKYIQV